MPAALAALVAATFAQPYIVPDAAPGSPTFITSWGLDPVNGCISINDRAAVREAIARLTILNYGIGTPELGQFQPYTFFPMAGRLNQDAFLIHSNDLDPEFDAFSDAFCTGATYDGHSGIDAMIRSFEEQGPDASEEGTPVFAALDGVVIFASDFAPDRNTSCAGAANAVVLMHTGGRRTYYWHLKRGSLRHSPGDVVRAGAQIGLVGSSGCSAWPHLHFETQINSARVETLQGVCAPSQPPYWVSQPPIAPSEPRVIDLGVTPETLLGLAPPYSYPRHSHVALTDARLSAWVLMLNVPENAPACTMLRRPDGSLALQSPMILMREPASRLTTLHAEWPIEMLESTPGVWRVQWVVDGAFRADVPFSVLPEHDPSFNRPPSPVTVSLSPAIPTGVEPIVCSVNTDPLFDDPDYDVVRYRYVWSVDGQEVRRVTSYASSDTLASGSASSLQTVRCVVTPMDARVSGPDASRSVTIGLPCGAAAAPIASVSPAALHTLLTGGAVPGLRLPDMDDSGGFDLTDLALMLSSFGVPCPE